MKKQLQFNCIWLIIISLCICITLFQSSCTTTELTPAYIQIDTVVVDAGGEEGTNSHNIKNIWLFVDNEPLGAYELPASIPILATGETKVSVLAGIANNGILSTRSIYPFYKSADFTLDLQPLSTIILAPTVKYKPETVFALINNFDTNNNFDDVSAEANQLQLTSDPSLVFEGARSAAVYLTSGGTSFDISTITTYQLPGLNKGVYLELDYKCSYPFNVFVGSFNASGEGLLDRAVVINRKETWNKIYVDLTEIVSQRVAQGYTNHKIYFSATLPADTTSASFFLDNVKLLYEP